MKVADFGLAKAVSADIRLTATAAWMGTVSYLAPELVVDGTSDARADVYALGVVLYELLTGNKPHEGESPIASPTSTSTLTCPRRPRPSPASRRTSTRWSPGPPPATATSARPTRACYSTSSTASPRPSPVASVDDEELTADLAPLRPRATEDTTMLQVDVVPSLRPSSSPRRPSSRTSSTSLRTRPAPADHAVHAAPPVPAAGRCSWRSPW